MIFIVNFLFFHIILFFIYSTNFYYDIYSITFFKNFVFLILNIYNIYEIICVFWLKILKLKLKIFFIVFRNKTTKMETLDQHYKDDYSLKLKLKSTLKTLVSTYKKHSIYIAEYLDLKHN